MTHPKVTISCYRGRFHRTCGKFLDNRGQVMPKKFLLFTDRAVAMQRAGEILQLWEVVKKHWELGVENARQFYVRTVERYAPGRWNRIDGTFDPSYPAECSEPLWDAESLMVANALRIGHGFLVVQPRHLDPLRPSAFSPSEYLETLQELREGLPFNWMYWRQCTRWTNHCVASSQCTMPG